MKRLFHIVTTNRGGRIQMVYTALSELPLVLSVQQLMEVLGIGRNTAYAMVRSGRIKSVRTGKQIRIPKEALIEFLQSE